MLTIDRLAYEWRQRKVFLLEEKEVIEPELLEQEAKLLKVPQGYNLWKEMEMFPFAYGNLKTDTIRVFGKSYQ